MAKISYDYLDVLQYQGFEKARKQYRDNFQFIGTLPINSPDIKKEPLVIFDVWFDDGSSVFLIRTDTGMAGFAVNKSEDRSNAVALIMQEIPGTRKLFEDFAEGLDGFDGQPPKNLVMQSSRYLH